MLRKPPFLDSHDLGGAAQRDPAQQGWGPIGSADGAGAQPPGNAKPVDLQIAFNKAERVVGELQAV